MSGGILMFKCPAINQVEHDTIGQTDARFRRVARSLGLEVCGSTTFDKFLIASIPRGRHGFAGQFPTV